MAELEYVPILFNFECINFQRQEEDEGSADYPEQDADEKALGLPANSKSIRVIIQFNLLAIVKKLKTVCFLKFGR